MTDGVCVIGGVQLAANEGKDAAGLPGTYKLGACDNSRRFVDAFYENGSTTQPPGILIGIPGSTRGD